MTTATTRCTLTFILNNYFCRTFIVCFHCSECEGLRLLPGCLMISPLTSIVCVVEVWIQTFLQPFANFLHVLLMDMFHKSLQIGLKEQKHIQLTKVSVWLHWCERHSGGSGLFVQILVSASGETSYLGVKLRQLFVVYVCLRVNSPLITKLLKTDRT